MADRNEQQNQWAKIITEAWAGEEYKRRLLEDPAGVMKDEGGQPAGWCGNQMCGSHRQAGVARAAADTG